MFRISRMEIVFMIAGAVSALISWPIGDAVGSVGKVLITAGALAALLVSLITLLFFHRDVDQMAIEVFRKEVAFFSTFAVFAVIVLVLTL